MSRELSRPAFQLILRRISTDVSILLREEMIEKQQFNEFGALQLRYDIVGINESRAFCVSNFLYF